MIPFGAKERSSDRTRQRQTPAGKANDSVNGVKAVASDK